MIDKKDKCWNLPQEEKYRVWSGQLLKQKVGKDRLLNNYLLVNDNYCINPNTIALYSFQENLLLGKYKSAIFDTEYGIILTRKSSRSVFTSFCNCCLLTGLEFQRELARKIHIQGQNIIATGRLAYFSTRSYNTGSFDWVALHQMADYQTKGKTSVTFETVPCGNTSYFFAFTNCSRYVNEKLTNGLVYNHALCLLAQRHLEQRSGWKIRNVRGNSLIDQPAYVHPHDFPNELSLKSIFTEVLEKKQVRYGQVLASVYELPYYSDYHKIACQNSSRPDTLF